MMSPGAIAVAAVSGGRGARTVIRNVTLSARRRTSGVAAAKLSGQVMPENPIARMTARSSDFGVPAGVPRYQIDTCGTVRAEPGAQTTLIKPATTATRRKRRARRARRTLLGGRTNGTREGRYPGSSKRAFST